MYGHVKCMYTRGCRCTTNSICFMISKVCSFGHMPHGPDSCKARITDSTHAVLYQLPAQVRHAEPAILIVTTVHMCTG